MQAASQQAKSSKRNAKHECFHSAIYASKINSLHSWNSWVKACLNSFDFYSSKDVCEEQNPNWSRLSVINNFNIRYKNTCNIDTRIWHPIGRMAHFSEVTLNINQLSWYSNWNYISSWCTIIRKIEFLC